MAYDGQTIIDIDVTRPDGDAEPKSVLDDVTKEIKRVLKNTPYSWASFLNQTGATLNVGDVVAVGSDGLIVNDTVGSFLKYVVAVESISASAIGLVAREGGPVVAKAAGPVVTHNYVRKSATSLAIEDTGIAATASLLIPNGVIGFALETTGGAGPCSIFMFEHTVTAPTDVSNHVLNLTNRTGVVVAAGSAVSPDAANDSSVVLNDVKGTLSPVLIAFESIPNITVGKWVQSGVFPVLINGTVSRLHYLRKSATPLALESTGVSASSIAARPPGTVGIALTEFVGGGTGTVQALMFGVTANVPAMSLSRVTNLLGQFVNSANRIYQCQRASLFNPLDGSTIVISTPSTYNNDTNFQGRGGRDQANLFNDNTFVYFYLTWDGTTLATRSSLNEPKIGPNLANGETHFAFLDVVRRGTGTLLNAFTTGEWSYYIQPVGLGVVTQFDPELALNISGAVPPTSYEFEVQAWGQVEMPGLNQGGFVDFDFRVFPGIPFLHARCGITGSSDANVKRDGLHMACKIPRTGYLGAVWTVAQNTSGVPIFVAAQVDILGYKNPV